MSLRGCDDRPLGDEKVGKARAKSDPLVSACVKITKKFDMLTISAFYFSMGLADVFILLFDIRMIHIGILAILCFIATVGLISLRRWGLYLAGVLAVLQGEVIVVALYVSVNLYGFYPNLLVNLALILWLILLVVVAVYLSLRKGVFAS